MINYDKWSKSLDVEKVIRILKSIDPEDMANLIEHADFIDCDLCPAEEFCKLYFRNYPPDEWSCYGNFMEWAYLEEEEN